MKSSHRLPLVATGVLLCMAGSAQSQPPDVVPSDSGQNTAMGTGALRNLPAPSGEQGNTAAGYAALFSDTTGGANTAVGANSLFYNTVGHYNAAFGRYTLYANVSGDSNVGLGEEALFYNVSGSDNVAVGFYALLDNASGYRNTALGSHALEKNTVSDNTALGFLALQLNSTGTSNTATGTTALLQNATGNRNTATGMQALYANTNGNNNTATGYNALYANTDGASNTADGVEALRFNTSGYHNTGSGAGALFSNTTGTENTAVGFRALYSNTTGSRNLALGLNAGRSLTTGSNNVDVANAGTAGDAGVIRIGTAGSQTSTYIAGITTAHITGSPVYISSSGQLGVLASSERYKTAVVPVEAETSGLHKLRPVRYHLRNDPSRAVQYGLIAEEVARVYPELVIRDERGTVQGVRYDELAPLLVKEMQHQQQTIQVQAAQLGDVGRQLAELKEANTQLGARIATLAATQSAGSALAQH
jgi:hypothetical protein